MISVIVPIYNMERYLNRCIESIVMQTYKELDIILIDDGSTDKSGMICDQWKDRDDRIKVFHKQNGGLSDARNTGIKYAEGDYLYFVDSDDYLESNMLENLIDALIQNNAEIAVCNFVYEYENADKCTLCDYQINDNMLMTGREFMLYSYGAKCTFGVVVWNKLFQKSLFQNISFPKGKVHEDEFVFHKLMYARKRICCIPFIGYHYLQRNGSITYLGAKFPDYMEAFMERCRYMLDQNDKELAVLSEGGLLTSEKIMKRYPQSKLKHELKKEHLKIVTEMYRRGWIKTEVLLKRIIRCIFL